MKDLIDLFTLGMSCIEATAMFFLLVLSYPSKVSDILKCTPVIREEEGDVYMCSQGLSVLYGNFLKVESRSVEILNVLQKKKSSWNTKHAT